MQIGYLDGLKFALDTGRVTLDDLYFQDEFPLYAGKVMNLGRARKNDKVCSRVPYMATRFTGSIVISNKGFVKADLIPGNMTDKSFQEFCLNSQESNNVCRNLGGLPLFSLLPKGSFIVWDRLGRSGRSKNPTRMHFNPAVHSALNRGGIQVVMLLPKGHMLNPAEL